MRSADRLLVAIAVCLLAFCAAYRFAPPGPFYYPVAGVWSMTKDVAPIGMAWYGRTLWGLAAAVLGGAAGWFATRRAKSDRPLSPLAVQGLSFAVLVCLVWLALGIFVKEFRHWGTWPFGG